MSAQPNRLGQGGVIDRGKPLTFTFNGETYQGYAGDTLASALMANGVDVISRSFKYHRRRGVQGAGAEDATSIVQLCGANDAPNILATQQPLYEGLDARSVNCWPSVNFDLGAALQVASPLLPSGFYYKTFMWPHWHAFEPFIRKAAGFGTSPENVTQKAYENRFGHCDVMIVGAGPAGLSAALAAGRSGARVLLVDETQQAGGSLLSSSAEVGNMAGELWVEQTILELDALENVERLQNATAWGYHEGNLITVIERSPEPKELAQRNRRVWAKKVVLATGAIERPIIFENNDLPGVMFSSAAKTYARRFGVLPGKSAVVFVNNDCAYSAALELKNAGVDVRALVDVRREVSVELSKSVEDAGITLLLNHIVVKAFGKKRVTGVSIIPRTGSGQQTLACDLLCVSGGWNPAVHLHSQSRGSIKYDHTIACFRPDESMQASVSVGGANGDFDLSMCLKDGYAAGRDAIVSLGFDAVGEAPKSNYSAQNKYTVEAFWSVQMDDKRCKAFADLAGDVTVSDLHLAVREGYSEIEHLKRYTTVGMGFDQGKTANVNTIGIVAGLLGKDLPDVGTTTFRSPYTLIEFGALAGSRRDMSVLPYRHTSITNEHKSAGTVMFEAGARWQRPSYYPVKSDETLEEAMYRESRAVRERVAMYDGSPLGKFELKGPDVTELLNLVYTNNWDGLEIGRGRYGFMLSEDGLMFDDGVTFRLDETRYFMSGATGNAPALEAKLDRLLNVEHADLKVLVTPMTSQWANVTVCGPLARDVLQSMGTDIDLSRDAFPFMSFREGKLAGIPVRVFRVSFTGELSFEVNTARRYGAELWRKVREAGEPHGICPIGSEANHLLRIEKGFISFGHEVDGVIDPIDLGHDWIISKKKTDFIGKRGMEIRRAGDRARQELVGLLTEDVNEVIAEGAPITPNGEAGNSEGFVSAAIWSVVNKRSIALGLLNNGRARHGETVYARVKGKVIPAKVTQPVFYDPDGEKLRM